MRRLEVLSYLGQIKEAREAFARAQTKFTSDVDAMMNRLLHEGARNFMSAEEIARASGMPVKRIRSFMRSAGLSPSDSKTLLSKKAAEALANNSALLGIEPSEMDLMSPLAYLPMGSVMKRELQDRSVSQVTDVSGNPLIEELQGLADAARLHHDLYHDNFANDTCHSVIKSIENRIAALESGL